MTHRTVTLSSPLMPQLRGAPTLVLHALWGVECLGGEPRYTLILATPDDDAISEHDALALPTALLRGAEFSVRIEFDGRGSFAPGLPGDAGRTRAGAGVREINGICTDVDFIGSQNRRALFRMTLCAPSYLMGRCTNSRWWVGRNIVAILREVLDAYPISVDWRLREADYPVRDFVVQYNETDLAFLRRRCEEAGIYSFWLHTGGIARLVMANDTSAHRPIDSEAYADLPFCPSGRKIDAPACDEFNLRHTLVTNVVAGSDYDATRERADLLQHMSLLPQVSGSALPLVDYRWSTSPDAAVTRVRLGARIAHSAARACVGRAFGQLANMPCGHTFRLRDHPREELNGEYLIERSIFFVTEVSQSSVSGGGAGSGAVQRRQRLAALGAAAERVDSLWDDDPVAAQLPDTHERYHVDSVVAVIPAGQGFALPQTTPVPRCSGILPGLVCGAANQEICTDPLGRVKVHLLFDRRAPRDENASHWIECVQPWAGSQLGTRFTPRVGQHVWVAFHGGDFDRPMWWEALMPT